MQGVTAGGLVAAIGEAGSLVVAAAVEAAVKAAVEAAVEAMVEAVVEAMEAAGGLEAAVEASAMEAAAARNSRHPGGISGCSGTRADAASAPAAATDTATDPETDGRNGVRWAADLVARTTAVAMTVMTRGAVRRGWCVQGCVRWVPKMPPHQLLHLTLTPHLMIQAAGRERRERRHERRGERR